VVLVTRAEPGTQQPLDVIFTVVGQYVLESKDRSGIPDEMIDKSFCALEQAGCHPANGAESIDAIARRR
jgi:hypothetical protein